MNASVNPQTVRAKRIAFLGVAVGFALAVSVLVWLRSPPSIGTAKSALKRAIKEAGAGRIAFTQLKVNKPQFVAFGGQEAWLVEFTGEVESKETCRWIGASRFSPGTFTTADLSEETLRGFKFDKSDRVEIEGMISFEKRGLRWKDTEYQVRPVRMSYISEPEPPKKATPKAPSPSPSGTPNAPKTNSDPILQKPQPTAPPPDNLILCSNRLRQLIYSAHVSATIRGNQLPRTFRDMLSEVTTPRLLICPADQQRLDEAGPTPKWSNFKDSMSTYVLVNPGLRDGNPTGVFLRCTIHNLKVMGDGKVVRE